MRFRRALRALTCSSVVAAAIVVISCRSESIAGSSAESSGTRSGLLVSTPEAERLDAAALAALIDTARAQKSDALVVLRNGRLVYENYFGAKDEPIMAMSATKSIVSLAVGLLIEDGKLASIDEPVAKMLPGFANNDSLKARITYRHLLTGTSGLSPARTPSFNLGDLEIHVTITSRCLFVPGTSWQYSNNAIDLLGLLVGKLAGKPMDAYLAEKLFLPLGITTTTWSKDRRGVPFGAGELSIRPIDLAKIGQMILDGGVWNDRRLIAKSWLDQSFVQSSPVRVGYGLLWWLPLNAPIRYAVTTDLLIQWVGNGLSSAIAGKLQPLTSLTFATGDELFAAIAARLTPEDAAALTQLQTTGDHIDQFRIVQASPGSSFYAAGWLGQYLDIVFDRKLVAVRMRRATPADYTSNVEENGFSRFITMALRLVPAGTP